MALVKDLAKAIVLTIGELQLKLEAIQKKFFSILF